MRMKRKVMPTMNTICIQKGVDKFCMYIWTRVLINTMSPNSNPKMRMSVRAILRFSAPRDAMKKVITHCAYILMGIKVLALMLWQKSSRK